ncbi:MAG TPA: AbrB/MazE/SpoVT family DNA-binding domain-containing protein [Candidatus Bathyarchaeia archaeon]
MTEVQVTSKGQITIPVELRRKHNIEEGGRVQVVEEEGKIVVKRAPSFYDLAGIDAGIATVEEIKQMLDRMREEDDEG